MSATAPDCDVDALLARIAACDVAGAEEAHARMMAATDAAEFADYGRTYQRLARSARQTLGLKARLTREQEAALRERALVAARRKARCQELSGALGEGLRIVTEPAERREAFERLEREIEAESERPDFLDADLDDLIADICARLPLEETAAATVERVAWASIDGIWPGIPDLPPSTDPEPSAARRDSG